jgi:hypothetical protein
MNHYLYSDILVAWLCLLLAGWRDGDVSLLPGDVVLAQQAFPCMTCSLHQK